MIFTFQVGANTIYTKELKVEKLDKKLDTIGRIKRNKFRAELRLKLKEYFDVL